MLAPDTAHLTFLLLQLLFTKINVFNSLLEALILIQN